MKIISLSLLSITLTLSLFARENPFKPTDHYLEQKEMVIKANELEKIKKEQDEVNKIAEEIAIKKEAKRVADQMIIDQEKIKKQAILEKEKAKQEAILEKEMAERKTILDKKTVALKKLYIPEIKENFKILPFVKIYIVNNVLTIKVDSKYKLLNQDIIKPDKKLLFDFKGKVSFYTIRKDIISEDFKSLTVGTHMENNFFRVVIDLPEDIINYIEKIDSKNNIITIMKKK